LPKNAKLVWTKEAESAFWKSKKILADATLLVYPVSNAPVSIYSDASDISMSGVLQVKINGIWSPVAFFSRRLTAIQQKYSAFYREYYWKHVML